MILEGEMQCQQIEKLMGATDPSKAEENTIRKLFGISMKKFSSWSDSVDNAKKEIHFFFKIKILKNFNYCLWVSLYSIIGFSFLKYFRYHLS